MGETDMKRTISTIALLGLIIATACHAASSEQKQYAFLWKIPDETHREVVRVLHREFDGKILDRSFDLEIAFWNRDRLADLARAPA